MKSNYAWVKCYNKRAALECEWSALKFWRSDWNLHLYCFLIESFWQGDVLGFGLLLALQCIRPREEELFWATSILIRFPSFSKQLQNYKFYRHFCFHAYSLDFAKPKNILLNHLFFFFSFSLLHFVLNPPQGRLMPFTFRIYTKSLGCLYRSMWRSM